MALDFLTYKFYIVFGVSFCFLLMLNLVDRDVSKGKKAGRCPICHCVGSQIANRKVRCSY